MRSNNSLGVALLGAVVFVVGACAPAFADPPNDIIWNSPSNSNGAPPPNALPSAPIRDTTPPPPPPNSGNIIWNTPANRDAMMPPQPPGASGPCREYMTTIRIGGQPQKAIGHACRQPDGTWRIVN